jgi:hypothetical protein
VEDYLHAHAGDGGSTLTEFVCPQGHAFTDDEAFCAVCGYERVPALVIPEPGESEMRRVIQLDPRGKPLGVEYSGGSLFALFFFVAAPIALVVGLVVLHAFVTIPRVHGVDHQETIGILVILSLTIVVTALLCFCGYVVEMLRELAFRSRRVES